jgi:predicted DCC family thiol-disulfide oxidoreductase YuxK
MVTTAAGEPILLVYDKQCPACQFYCNLARIRADVGQLILVDARDAGSVMNEITAAGLDIDQGMVLKVGGQIYYGSEAIHALSLMSTRTGLFNRITYWCFRSHTTSRVVYPLLRSMRNLLLKFLGKTKVNNLGAPGNDRF